MRNESKYSLLVLISAIATETHSFLAALYPPLKEGIKKDLFWSADFKMEIDVLWYIKMIFDNLFIMTILFVGAALSFYTSKKLFYIFSIFLFYNMVDFFSFCWNFKQTTGMYWVFLLCAAAAVLMIIFKQNKMRAV